MAMEYWGNEWGEDKMQAAWQKAIDSLVRYWGKSHITNEVIQDARHILIDWCGYEEHEVPQYVPQEQQS
jgi:DNA-directed RNA polymerase specialized sigma24 family protein